MSTNLDVTSVYDTQYLPVYYPSEEEKNDPKLYGNNVRALMAKYATATHSYHLESQMTLCTGKLSPFLHSNRFH